MKKYFIISYPIAFLTAFVLAVYFTSLIPLVIVAVLMVFGSKLTT